MGNTKRCVLYLRASTNEEKQANSLMVQRAIVRNFAAKYQYEVLGEYVEYASGTDDSRPQFNLDLKHAEEKNLKVICFRVDRLSRSLSVFSKINGMLSSLRFVELGDTPPNLMVISVLIACAQNEVENTRIRVKETLRILKERDGRNWGNPNIVKDAHPKSIQVRKNNALEFNTRIQSIVRDLRDCGYTIEECADRLNYQMQIKTRRGALWSRQSLSRVLAY